MKITISLAAIPYLNIDFSGNIALIKIHILISRRLILFKATYWLTLLGTHISNFLKFVEITVGRH